MNEKKKLRRLPKRILSFVLTLTMILTLLPISSTIVYADTLQIPNDATIIEEDYRKDDAGSFYLYLVDKNGNEELYGKLFYDRFVSTKTIMLSTDIKSVRLVKDSGYEVNLDQLTLNGIAPNGFERKLSKTDKDLIELENVLTFELQGKGNLVISARAPKTVSDESLAVKFPNSNFMKTITMDSECYTYDMDSNVCTLSNVKIVPDKSNLFKSVIAYPGSGHPLAPIDYYVANDDDYLYIYSEVFGDNTLDHGKDHSGIYVLCDDEVKYYAVYTTEENEYGYWDFTYTNSRLEYDYQHMTYLVKIPRADILDAGNSVKLVFEYYGTLSGHEHEWEYRSEGPKIIATCNGGDECDANNGEAEISLIAEPKSYSGDSCSFSKADIFGKTDFETFYTATGKRLSVSDIKIYATDDEGNKTGLAIDLVTSKGQYIAELECEIPDYSKTHSPSKCEEEGGHSGIIEIKKVWGSWWTSKGDTAGYCSLQEGNRIESLNINLSGGGKVYLDNVALTENRENVSAKIVKLDGDEIYLCTNHDASVNNVCTTCGYGDKLNPVAKIVFDVTQNHAHGSWTYQTDGATLTATCGVSGCELSDSKVSLTLTATSQTYSGIEYSGATVKDSVDKVYSASDNAWKVANAGEVTVKYVGRDGTTYSESTTAPTKIGKYTVKLYPSSEESTRTHVATADFEITRKTDYDGKLIDFADTNWEYKFYTSGSFTSNVAGDTSGTVEKLKFYNISGAAVSYVGASFSDTPDSHRSIELTPSMIAGLISSVTNGVGVTCAYNASAHTLTITPIVHTHDWKYSATGNKLEAYCANADCPSGTDADHKVSITLTASSQNYSGSAVTASYGDGEAAAWKTAVGSDAPTITYEAKSGSSLTDDKAVNVGSYTAKATVNDGTTDYTATVDFTITRPTSGGSSAPTITVPVTGNENSVKVSASVSGSTATVKTMTDAELNKVTGGEAVEIDLTGLKKDIDTAKIPTATVEKIAEQGGMSVKLSTATVTFDAAATQTITEQAKGNTIELVVDDIQTVSLNAVQKETVQKLDAALIIDAYLVSNGTRLCSESKGGFSGGKATVALPYEIKGNRTAANYSVYYVDDAGKLEKLNASYDAATKAFVFDIEHFSNYVVAYDENAMLFVDVAEGSFYYDAVLWAAKNGITTGADATHFNPNGGTTRAHVVTFLWRAAGYPEPKSMNSFADVEAGSYYEKAVAWGIENGVVKGTSPTTFSPDMVCTRAHIAAFMARFAGVVDADCQTSFTDVSVNAYYASAVAWMLDNGVTEGTTATTYSPDADCTRAQIVTFLYRWMVK